MRSISPSVARNRSPRRLLRRFGGRGVLEVVESDVSGTYRAVYTVRFADCVYVLHCFQKKSTKGIATQQHDVELIKARLHAAAADHAKCIGGAKP
ncbi:type II toxin-antitoxin system RelE/ParE family toxin [Methylobacterium indicum]|uniref:type II toxin-antitoxin system RelE/ParE family toxin n=1 Tax=Methylobacterium indicum TaxID=1775910 RepID=UPI0030B90E73